MHEIVLHFHDLKHARNLMRKLSQGKGVVVREEHLGGGWFNGIANGLRTVANNPIVHRIGEKALDKSIDLAGKYAENKLMNGAGFFDDIKRISSNPVVGKIGNTALNLGAKYAENKLLGGGLKRRGRPRKHHKEHEHDGQGIFGDIGSVIDAISGDGLKKIKKIKKSRALELYQGGSFSTL